MLLKAGAWLTTASKNELHLLAEIGGSKILSLILKDERCCPTIINTRDIEGRSALHIAAQYLHRNCLRMLVEHGGDLLAVDMNGDSVIDIIFEQLIRPEEFISEIFDDCITSKKIALYKWDYVIDFRVLAWKTRRRQMEVISNILLTAREKEKMKILQHPLIELFLILKWRRICYFFYLWLVIYFIFAVSLGTYVTLIVHNVQQTVVFNIVKHTVILTSMGLLGHAVLQCILIRGNYLGRYEMWMNLICTCLSLVLAVCTKVSPPIEGDIKTNHVNNTPEWILHISSIAVLMAWIELMLLVGRLPSLGYYALMFSAVVQNVFKVLLAFSCLIIGFVLSFSVLFRYMENFSNPWRALVKTTVMMMGEYDYDHFFSFEQGGHLDVTSRLIFLIFILLATIILMNLMVGLIVSDIQELHLLGRSKNLEKQAEFLSQLEKVISSLDSDYVPGFVKNLLLRRNFIDLRFEVNSSPEFQRTEDIPRNLIDALIAIGRGKQQKEINVE